MRAPPLNAAVSPNSRNFLHLWQCRLKISGFMRTLLSGSIQQYQKNKTANCGLFFLVRAKGIEPSSKAWEALILPLDYARNARHSNFVNIKKKGK